jgi:hypothetical protein
VDGRKTLSRPKDWIAVRLEGGHVGLDNAEPVYSGANKGATRNKEVFEAALLVRPNAEEPWKPWKKSFLLRMQMMMKSEKRKAQSAKRKHLGHVHDHVIR